MTQYIQESHNPKFPLPVPLVGMSQQLSCCQAVVSGAWAHPLQSHAWQTCREQETQAEVLLHVYSSLCSLSPSVPVPVTLCPQD